MDRTTDLFKGMNDHQAMIQYIVWAVNMRMLFHALNLPFPNTVKNLCNRLPLDADLKQRIQEAHRAYHGLPAA